jgi:hypothetical protein
LTSYDIYQNHTGEKVIKYYKSVKKEKYVREYKYASTKKKIISTEIIWTEK